MSTAIMEIKMPKGISDLTLKTGGKYCEKDIRVTSQSKFRMEKGVLNIGDEDVVPGKGVATAGQYKINCSSGCKLFVLTADEDTVTAIKARTDTILLTLGVVCGFANVDYEDIASQNKSTCAITVWIPSQSKESLGGGAASNEDGVSIYSYCLAKNGKYYWTAYYWED